MLFCYFFDYCCFTPVHGVHVVVGPHHRCCVVAVYPVFYVPSFFVAPVQNPASHFIRFRSRVALRAMRFSLCLPDVFRLSRSLRKLLVVSRALARLAAALFLFGRAPLGACGRRAACVFGARKTRFCFFATLACSTS